MLGCMTCTEKSLYVWIHFCLLWLSTWLGMLLVCDCLSLLQSCHERISPFSWLILRSEVNSGSLKAETQRSLSSCLEWALKHVARPVYTTSLKKTNSESLDDLGKDYDDCSQKLHDLCPKFMHLIILHSFHQTMLGLYSIYFDIQTHPVIDWHTDTHLTVKACSAHSAPS